MMTDDEFHGMATRYLEDALDESDRQRLNRELLESPERVRQFNDLRMLAGMILEHGRSEQDVPKVVEFAGPELVRRRWKHWLPAAAALTIGVFLGILLNGNRIDPTDGNRSSDPAALSLIDFDFDFEQRDPVPVVGFPRKPGFWSGDPIDLATNETSDVSPWRGNSMACLIPPASKVPAPAPFAPDPVPGVQWRIVDLAKAGSRGKPGVARLRVQFNRDAEVANPDLPCRMELYSFRGSPETAESQLKSEDYLSAAVTNFLTDSDPETWETANSRLPIAPEADFLLIGISGFAERQDQPSGGEKFSGHYADGVELTLHSNDEFIIRKP